MVWQKEIAWKEEYLGKKFMIGHRVVEKRKIEQFCTDTTNTWMGLGSVWHASVCSTCPCERCISPHLPSKSDEKFHTSKTLHIVHRQTRQQQLFLVSDALSHDTTERQDYDYIAPRPNASGVFPTTPTSMGGARTQFN